MVSISFPLKKKDLVKIAIEQYGIRNAEHMSVKQIRDEIKAIEATNTAE